MKAKLFAVGILLFALYCAYFFIRHSFIIVSLAPVLGVVSLVVILAALYIYFSSGSKKDPDGRWGRM